MFDMNALDILKPSEEGKWFYPLHPATGKKLTPPAKPDRKPGEPAPEPFGILFYGIHSAVARDALRQMQDARAAIIDAGRTLTEADAERLQGEYLARCTKGWVTFELDGQPFPYTAENAIKFWCDMRFRWMHTPAREFISSEAAFLAG